MRVDAEREWAHGPEQERQHSKVGVKSKSSIAEAKVHRVTCHVSIAKRELAIVTKGTAATNQIGVPGIVTTTSILLYHVAS